MMRSNLLVACCATAALAIAGCSEGSTTETSGPRSGLHILSGGTGIDTIEAALPTPLVVEVRDDSLRPVADKRVIIFVDGLPTGVAATPTAAVTLTFDGAIPVGTFPIAVNTDANGRITAHVRLGKGVGNGKLSILVAGTQLRDSAQFTVVAGKPARVTLQPRDTALYPAARLVLRQTVRDRLGNATTGNVATTYSTSDGLTVSSGGIATPRDPGRAFVVAHTGVFADSIALTVLPVTGTLVASLPPTDNGAAGVAVMNLDGSGYKEYAKNLGPMLSYSAMRARWTYDGKALIVRIGLQSDVRLWTVPLDGSAPHRFLINPTSPSEDYPTPSPDGQWVYYCSRPNATSNRNVTLRAKLDGTGIQALPVVFVDPLDDICDQPAVSSNGEWFAWTLAGRMKTRGTMTGVNTAFNREGYSASWAPTGTRVAYIKGNPGPLYTAEYDGSDDRFIAQGYYFGPLSWTPDGKFILALRGVTNKWELIDVATGATYALPFAIGPEAVLKPAVKP